MREKGSSHRHGQNWTCSSQI